MRFSDSACLRACVCVCVRPSACVQVTTYIATGSNCFSVTTGGSALLLGVKAASPIAQGIPRNQDGSSAYMFEVFQKPPSLSGSALGEAQISLLLEQESNGVESGIPACDVGYFGSNCSQRVCAVGLDHTGNNFHRSIDSLYTPSGRSSTAPNAEGGGHSCVWLSGQVHATCSTMRVTLKVLACRILTTGACHRYAECSNAGICDRRLGECRCNVGFEGSACQRRSCPKNRRGRTCSHRGKCVTNHDRVVGAHAPIEEFNAFGSVAWSLNTIMACECDGG